MHPVGLAHLGFHASCAEIHLSADPRRAKAVTESDGAGDKLPVLQYDIDAGPLLADMPQQSLFFHYNQQTLHADRETRGGNVCLRPELTGQAVVSAAAAESILCPKFRTCDLESRMTVIIQATDEQRVDGT